jgi:uncharacterized repeat protein (TIGR03833 family)
MDGKIRKNINIGDRVLIVEKHNQKSGKLTEGYVSRILTNSKSHPHGIKIMTEDNIVGRVKEVKID